MNAAGRAKISLQVVINSMRREADYYAVNGIDIAEKLRAQGLNEHLRGLYRTLAFLEIGAEEKPSTVLADRESGLGNHSTESYLKILQVTREG